jgi:hypothetical protein
MTRHSRVCLVYTLPQLDPRILARKYCPTQKVISAFNFVVIQLFTAKKSGVHALSCPILPVLLPKYFKAVQGKRYHCPLRLNISEICANPDPTTPIRSVSDSCSRSSPSNLLRKASTLGLLFFCPTTQAGTRHDVAGSTSFRYAYPTAQPTAAGRMELGNCDNANWMANT